MSADEVESRRWDWRDCCPWIMLVRTFAMAISVQVLLLATVGAVASSAGWRLASSVLFHADVLEEDTELARDVKYLNLWPGQRGSETCRFAYSWVDQFADVLGAEPPADPLTTVPLRIGGPLLRLLERGQSWRSFVYYVCGWLWMLLVWSLFGTAITRLAVLRFGRDERIDLKAAVGYARQSLFSQLSAVTLPLVGVFFIAVPIAILGLMMRLDVFVVLAGLVWPLVLLAAVGMALLLVGLLFGWPLMWGAIAAEGSDGFDAISRAYAYAIQRALNYLGYATFVMFVGLLGWLLVWGFSEGVISLAEWAAAWGMGPVQGQRVLAVVAGAPPDGGLLRVGAALLSFGNGVVRTLASAYGYGYFFCAAAAVYLLLRHDLDHTELDDIQSAADATSYGLPQLTEEE